jgi:hypothetical protein
LGRFDTVTNGSYRESEFNDGFQAMNLKRPTDAIDPKLSDTLHQVECLKIMRKLTFWKFSKWLISPSGIATAD